MAGCNACCPLAAATDADMHPCPLSGSINIAAGKTNPACTAFGPLDSAWRCAPFCTWGAGQGKLTANLGGCCAVLRCAVLCCAACAVFDLVVRPLMQHAARRQRGIHAPHGVATLLPTLLPLPRYISINRLEGPVDDEHRHKVAAQHPRGLLSGPQCYRGEWCTLMPTRRLTLPCKLANAAAAAQLGSGGASTQPRTAQQEVAAGRPCCTGPGGRHCSCT